MKIETLRRPWLLPLLLLLCLPVSAVAGSGHDHDDTAHAEDVAHDDEAGHDAHEDQVSIDSAIAEKTGITTAVAGPGLIRQHRQVYGRLVVPPRQRARLQARFPGVVTAVAVQVGSRVERGDVLARIESDSSLQTYALRAPLSGTVQSVRVSVGETTGSTPLFEVIDTAALWAELKVFPGVRQAVKTGQTVLVTLGQGAIKSRIASITPVGDQPYVLARVPIDNADQRAVPGELVSARIVTATDRVPLAVDNRAVQYLRGEPVVFVKEGNAYQARPVRLGISDGTRSEVLSGLAPGATYVVGESYLIKADLLKAGASHSH